MNHGFNLLIVDDVIDNIELVISILKDKGYNLFYAMSGKQALGMIEAEPDKFDFILLDVMMPELDGFETCTLLKKNPKTSEIPIVFVTAKDDIESMKHGFDIGGIDYITKPFHPIELQIKVKNHLSLHQAKVFLQQHNIDLEQKLIESQHQYITEMEASQQELIAMLMTFIETSSYEEVHKVRRIAEMSALLAHYHPDISQEEQNTLYHAASLHDIGKVAIPQEILHKNTPLTPKENQIMKTHTIIGQKMLSVSKRTVFVTASTIAHQHHERWDGTGYPQGLKGEEIDLYARIVSVVDVLDNLMNGTTYNKAWSFDKAIHYIQELKEFRFDPQLVDILCQHQEEFREICHL